MPKYFLRRDMNYRGGVLPQGQEITADMFDRQRMGQLIRINWVREDVDPTDSNDHRNYNDEGRWVGDVAGPTPMTPNEAVTLAKTTGDDSHLLDTPLEGAVDVTATTQHVDEETEVESSSESSTDDDDDDDEELGDGDDPMFDGTGLTERQQTALIEAGFDSQIKVDAATDEQLLAVPGIGDRALERLRQR